MSPKKYITERLVSSYANMFGEQPSTKAYSPLDHGGHSELDDSDLLDDDGIQKEYRSTNLSLAHFNGSYLWGDLIYNMLSCSCLLAVLHQALDI